MLKVVANDPASPQEFLSVLDEIAREGARRMLAQALRLEADEYLERHKDLRDDEGKRLVVGDGAGRPWTLTLGSGAVTVSQPRVIDRREGQKFTSEILPPYLRKSPKVESLLPILYLKGLSTSDFQSALSEFLGEGTMGLSPTSIVKLKKVWEDEFAKWEKRLITKRYVYLWADGVNVQVRLGEDKKICLLVNIGVTEDGKKELLAIHPGYRESKDSLLHVLHSLIDRGMSALLVAAGGTVPSAFGAL